MMRAAFSRWRMEEWFERAKQEAGLGAFEVRRYKGLLRHWFCSRLAMYFMTAATQRLRGKNPRITFEQVAEAASGLAAKIWNRYRYSYAELIERYMYYQWRNAASYESRRRKAERSRGP